MLVKDVSAWNRIVGEEEGYIYNDFGTQFPGASPKFNTRDNNKLHRASCRHVKRMTYVSDGRLTKHFFQSRKEAIDWLEVNRKSQGYTLCVTCSLLQPIFVQRTKGCERTHPLSSFPRLSHGQNCSHRSTL